ncbi:hypothetical protein [Candidatus Berkiella aquae]|uniref:Uncharacterized protein n=1 Tax=Candidatus Berkiella aquae TaxID=295108 RepID=A0A0Q9YXQ3_9GAMM|nr:hypothetical protein [Candidatus Berkiella aquae]MCS5710124.1 hypothetical protein [Candidatus Berkiella aquae]
MHEGPKKEKKAEKKAKELKQKRLMETKITPSDIVPKLTFAERIISEMHQDTLPSPTTPKVVPQIPFTLSSAPTIIIPQIGWFAKLWSWVRGYFLRPIFSRQQQINATYTQQLTRTLNAIHRNSANDKTHPQKTLRFSGQADVTGQEPSSEFENTEHKIKPTIH